MLYNLQI